jgi:glucose/mannose-6-phosphate isomerase
MGGSALPVDIIKTYLEEIGTDLEIVQNRTYGLPKKSYKNSLNFISSHSGNTEETISAFNEALENKLPMVVFTNGGQLLELAKNNNIPLVIIPDCVQPRCAVGYFFSAMMKVLINSGLTKDISSDILNIQEYLQSIMATFQEKGLIIAKKLVGQTPIVYSSDKLKSIALILKIEFNENAKTPAFWNTFPELNHNEMVGWTLPQGQFHILIFQEKNIYPQIAKRMQITADLLKAKNIETEFIKLEADNILNTIFSALIMGNWISYYLSLEYGQDPTPVEMVEEFKKLL